MCLHPLNARDVLGKGRKLNYTWLGIRASLDVCLHLLSDEEERVASLACRVCHGAPFIRPRTSVSSSIMCLSACVSGELH